MRYDIADVEPLCQEKNEAMGIKRRPPEKDSFLDRLEEILATDNHTAIAEATGIDKTTLKSWARKGSIPSGEILNKIIDKLHIEERPEYLMCLVRPKAQPVLPLEKHGDGSYWPPPCIPEPPPEEKKLSPKLAVAFHTQGSIKSGRVQGVGRSTRQKVK